LGDGGEAAGLVGHGNEGGGGGVWLGSEVVVFVRVGGRKYVVDI
jgi:hypothetical protein